MTSIISVECLTRYSLTRWIISTPVTVGWTKYPVEIIRTVNRVNGAPHSFPLQRDQAKWVNHEYTDIRNRKRSNERNKQNVFTQPKPIWLQIYSSEYLNKLIQHRYKLIRFCITHLKIRYTKRRFHLCTNIKRYDMLWTRVLNVLFVINHVTLYHFGVSVAPVTNLYNQCIRYDKTVSSQNHRRFIIPTSTK